VGSNKFLYEFLVKDGPLGVDFTAC